MEYNKTKRILELIAGIIGMIGALGLAICGIVQICGTIKLAILASSEVGGVGAYFVGYIILYCLLFLDGGAGAFICCSLIRKPEAAGGVVKSRDSLRITALVLFILNGNLIALGLMIAVLCLKDYTNTVPVDNAGGINYNAQQTSGLDRKLAELKHLKELCVIDEDTYKNAVEKLIKSEIEK